MKKLISLLVGVLAFVPSITLAAPISNIQLNPIIIQPVISNIPKILTCSVESSNKLVGLTNVVTYKVHFVSNYSKINAPYQVSLLSVTGGPLDIVLEGVGGSASVISGKGYLRIQGSTENTLSYTIQNHSKVRVAAKIDGVSCTTKTLNTIQAAVNRVDIVQPTITPQINPNIVVTTSIHLPVVPPAVEPAYTCKMLIEAMAVDSDTILIGGAISFDHLKVGQYPYTVRGYRSDEPNNVTKFTGFHNAKLDTDNGLVFGQEGKAFLFTYDSKVKTDSYIITATLGNVDCSAVLFPSHLQEPENNDVNGAAVVPPSADDQSGDTVSHNGGSVAGESTTVEDGVTAVGVSNEDREAGANLDLLNKTGDSQVQAVIAGNKAKEAGFLPATGALAPDEDEAPWTSKDYTLVGLLGAILVAGVGYGIMKYRGMV